MRTLKWVGLGAVLLTTSAAAAKGWRHGGGHHHGPQRDDECTAFYGPFSSQTGEPCESPIGLCTHGALQGEIPAQYDFTFETLESANDASDPSKFVYTGYSVVTALDGSGVAYTDDTGIIHMTESGPAPFVTKAIIVDGTRKFANADGGFVATGNLTFETGFAVGNYSAVLCKPKRR
ncbi:MAG TPA: hypothetical protein VFX59_04580 [Polyangiales bacterium]|nr:hypothetical protein [Polyangiales bacterium]